MSILKIKDENGNWIRTPAGGVGVPSGGTAGQILMKSSATDYADEWADISEAGAMSAWELLWTNASPTSSFAEQNVTLATGYDIILIFFASDTASGHSSRIKSVMFPTGVANPGFYVDFSNGSDKYIGSRVGTYSATTGVLNIAQGYYNGSQNNSWCIPQLIYGIKGVNS